MDQKIYQSGRMYQNPYSASHNNKCERRKYYTFRHFTKKYPDKLSRDEIIKICQNRDYERYEIYRNEEVIKKRLKTIKNNLEKNKIKENDTNCYYPTPDDEGIIERNKSYILYKDKVWSVGHDRYLKPLTNSKGTYCLLYASAKFNEKRYEKYYITA